MNFYCFKSYYPSKNISSKMLTQSLTTKKPWVEKFKLEILKPADVTSFVPSGNNLNELVELFY